jgi:UDP-N-acetylmuramoylalanine--D-glutamate ligase
MQESKVDFRGKRIVVMGLGRFGGGVGVSRWLAEQGARVTVTDQADGSSLAESIETLHGLPVEFQLGGHDPAILDRADLAVINPAVVKQKSEFFRLIETKRLPWTTEMNLFCERCPAAVIGVTGSFGKSTTCAMLTHALEACLRAAQLPWSGVHLGGNIGRSLLGELPRIQPNHIVVLEMSNAQLDDLPRIAWTPQTAVITNIHPHHLDRHGSLQAYVRAKLNILPRGGRAVGGRLVIAGPMHEEVEPVLREAAADAGAGLIRVPPGDAHTPLSLTVPGPHNEANARCVLTVCRALALDEPIVRRALAEFGGLPHRLQHVRTVDGVQFINDSKSTAPSATIVALESLARPVVLILGGQKKDAVLDELTAVVRRTCRAVVCMGDAGPTFAAALGDARTEPNINTAANMVEAVRQARARSREGDIILLSPGAPSFDQYVNFEARGNHFVQLVRSI